MVLHDKTEHLFTFNLSHFQRLIEKQLKDEASQFIRIGKSLIINRDYIYRINLTKQQLVMSDMALNQAFMLSASKEALKQLKQLLENELK
jgi:DNA-binding LytR/AlgR family response regulator